MAIIWYKCSECLPENDQRVIGIGRFSPKLLVYRVIEDYKYFECNDTGPYKPVDDIYYWSDITKKDGCVF